MMKKGMPVLARSVISLYGAKTRVRVESDLSEENEVLWRCVVSSFIFVVVVHAVTELARYSALSELLYTDDLVMMSETIEGLRNKIKKC